MRVCGAQLAVTHDIEANVAGLLRAVEHAAAAHADVLLTPEGSLSGYTSNFSEKEAARGLRRITSAAAQAGVALALGTCYVETDDTSSAPAEHRPSSDGIAICNEVRFYDRSGTFLGFHAKTLLCGTLDANPSGEINDFGTRPLRTFTLDGIKVGALICNDLWANPGCTPMDDPHLTQKLANMGARVIFHAVNGGRDGGEWSRVAWAYHESNLQLRARAARVWIVTADNAHPFTLPCSSPSGVVGPDGRWLIRCEPQGEQYFVADLPLQPAPRVGG